MIKSHKITLIFLLIPILSLLTLTFYKRHIVLTGDKVILPIEGYDPRSLLSGHYLIYRVTYPYRSICATSQTYTVYVCLKEKAMSRRKPNCRPVIKGKCENYLFKSGIERFYIPEKYAKKLDKKLRSSQSKATIEVSVLPSGEAQVTNLFFDGVSWENF